MTASPQLAAWPIAHDPPPRPIARPLRVAFCLDNLGVGGTELNAVRTAECIDRRTIDARLITLQATGPLLSRFEAAGVPVIPFEIDGLASRSAFRQGYRLARYLRESGIDIVHCHDMFTNVFVLPWARLAGVRIVISSRRWWQSLPNAKHRVANRLAYRFATRVLANSRIVGESLIRDDGVSPEKVVVVPNFVDESAFAPLAHDERNAMCAKLGLPTDAIIVGSVARLEPVKDHSSLVKAISVLASRHPGLRLVLVGDGSCRHRLESEVAALGITDRVRFTGLVHGTRNLHAVFDISVLTSLSEGFPNTVIEAMAARRPVVATDVGGVSDAVVDGETGFLVPSRSPSRLTGALDILLRDAVLRTRMGTAGQQRARAHFHVSSIMSSLEAIYQRLAAESP